MDYLLHRLNLKLTGKPAPIKKARTPIKKRSAKRVVEDRELKKLFLERFEIDPTCQLRSPVCSGIAEGFDHTQKTSPGNRTNPKNLKLACNACNGFKETAKGQQWAKSTGNHISRFKPISLKQ